MLSLSLAVHNSFKIDQIAQLEALRYHYRSDTIITPVIMETPNVSGGKDVFMVRIRVI